jgi:formylglycine-generating enzyme required for sulfatase activity
LYSNVSEWTCSWASVYPPLLDYEGILPQPIPREEGTYIVRGGPFSVIQKDPDPKQYNTGPRHRIAQHKKALQPGLGFRCVRSLRPHLEAASLERYVRDDE